MDAKLNLSGIRLSEMKVRVVILNSCNGRDSFKKIHPGYEVPHIPIAVELEAHTTVNQTPSWYLPDANSNIQEYGEFQYFT